MPTILFLVDTETAVDDLPGIEVRSESADGVVDVVLDDVSDLLEEIDLANVEVAVGTVSPSDRGRFSPAVPTRTDDEDRPRLW
jgi:hypothetical protein